MHILHLWQGAWIAALVTGVITWALIIGVPIYFRRRSDDEVPVQTRYNLPIEIFYTIFPVIMVVAFFSHTVRVQNIALEHVPNPDVVVKVVGQKWQWTFNYPDSEAAGGKNLFINSTGGDDIPQLGDPGGQDGRVRPLQPRRHPRLRRPGVRHAHGRRPGQRQLLPGHPDRDRHLRRQVLRALRRLPLADAVHRQGRDPVRVRRLPGQGSPPTRTTSPTAPSRAAGTPST
ncbi:hypothetical protein [Nocardioides convexus]|uniref:hypothetical protein n=1 Tax=Nocardioides convexus TaxID=2712224 RepID=UPI00241854CE|nr:hypothetical protein [Nocardioides convexus]